ncbi:DUF3378 domain-containing protein [Oceanobacillus rekensis]|uniref:DUF3378 domain-containing protein n=1 Tax=Oceanobacillus rekensis TaxID=937927 RepID=UPI000B44D4FA|nr:DUF3378 domain-containing protein [Oceanobacillus rekensis]
MKKHYQQALTQIKSRALYLAKTPEVSITSYKSRKVLLQSSLPESESGKWTIGVTVASVVREKNSTHFANTKKATKYL